MRKRTAQEMLKEINKMTEERTKMPYKHSSPTIAPPKPSDAAVSRGNRHKRYSNSRSNLQNRLIALENKLKEICLEIYALGEEKIIPVKPFILVRVLPRDKITSGGILIPDTGQNKPMFEAIVLKTYKPYTVEEVNYVEGVKVGIKITAFECSLKPGDRIAFPYYEGIAFNHLGDPNYRLIRESCDQIKYPYQQCLGTIDYEGDKEIAAEITRLMKQYYSVTESGIPISRGEDPTKVAK